MTSATATREAGEACEAIRNSWLFETIVDGCATDGDTIICVAGDGHSIKPAHVTEVLRAYGFTAGRMTAGYGRLTVQILK